MFVRVTSNALSDRLTPCRKTIRKHRIGRPRYYVRELDGRMTARVYERDRLQKPPTQPFLVALHALEANAGIIFVASKFRGDGLERLACVAMDRKQLTGARPSDLDDSRDPRPTDQVSNDRSLEGP